MLRLGQSLWSGRSHFLSLSGPPRHSHSLLPIAKCPGADEASGKQKASCLCCSYFLLGNSNPLRQRSTKALLFAQNWAVAGAVIICTLIQNCCSGCSVKYRVRRAGNTIIFVLRIFQWWLYLTSVATPSSEGISVPVISGGSALLQASLWVIAPVWECRTFLSLLLHWEFMSEDLGIIADSVLPAQTSK